MNPIIRFILVAAASASVVVIIALLWPKFTSNPRPYVLQAVRDSAMTSPAGQEAARILGVEKEEAIKPINAKDITASVAGAVSAAIQEKTKEIIAQQVTTQIVNQYQSLPQSQQQQLQEFICKPK